MLQHLGAIEAKIHPSILMQFSGNANALEKLGDKSLCSIRGTCVGNTPGANGDFLYDILERFHDDVGFVLDDHSEAKGAHLFR